MSVRQQLINWHRQPRYTDRNVYNTVNARAVTIVFPQSALDRDLTDIDLQEDLGDKDFEVCARGDLRVGREESASSS